MAVKHNRIAAPLTALVAALAVLAVPTAASAQSDGRRGGGGRMEDHAVRGDSGWRQPAQRSVAPREAPPPRESGGGWSRPAPQVSSPAPAPAPRSSWGGGNRGSDGGNSGATQGWRGGNRGGEAGNPGTTQGWRGGNRGGGSGGGWSRPAPGVTPPVAGTETRTTGSWTRGGTRDGVRSGDETRRDDRNWRGREGNRGTTGSMWRGRSDDRSGWSGNHRRGDDSWRGNDGRRYDRGDHRRWNSRDWRRDSRYDWYSYRRQNHNLFSWGVYYAPYSNYRYSRLSIGYFLDSLFYSDRYWINDPWQYRLPEAYGPYRWVRYYDDALLVDIYSGEVVDVIYGFFW